MTAELTPEVTERLTGDDFGWLTTVAKSGLPVPRLIWFFFDGTGLFVYTMPNAAKVTHVRRHPQVSLNLIPTARAAASSSSVAPHGSTPKASTAATTAPTGPSTKPSRRRRG